MPRRPLVVAASLSLLILLAKLAFAVPALSDPTGAALPAGVYLAFPVLNLLLAPLFDLWDGVTLLAMPRLNAFLVGAVILGAAWSLGSSIVNGRLAWGRATARLACFIVTLGAFVLGGIRWRRPMAHIAGVPHELFVVDLHSHTSRSHDAKGLLQRDFDVAVSTEWHRRGGFDVFFVTDHNLLNDDAQASGGRGGSGTVSCRGEELSLWGAHIVVLGNSDSIPRDRYADSAPGIARLLRESKDRWHGVTLASIPEYDENHFVDLPEWIRDGLNGFEVSNAAPKANRQTVAHRDSVTAMARASGRWIAGVTDQHGMGATVQAWTLVPKALWKGWDSSPCQGVMDALFTLGVNATEVIERHRLRLDSPWPLFTTVIATPWEGWRAAGVWQLVSWLAWIWGLALVTYRRRPTGDPSLGSAQDRLSAKATSG